MDGRVSPLRRNIAFLDGFCQPTKIRIRDAVATLRPGGRVLGGVRLVGKVSPRIRSAVLYNFLPLLCDREGDIRARVDLLNGGIVNKSGFIFGQGGERGSRESLIDENRRGRGSRIRRTSVNIKRRETKRYDK